MIDRIVACSDPHLTRVYKKLAGSSENPALDARVLLSRILDRPVAWVLAHPEAALSPDQESRLNTSLARLLAGEPLPYVIGEWEFFGRSFQVNPSTLIPRPETELIVERGLDWINSLDRPARVLDVGTGSGCIAVSLSADSRVVNGVATDVSFTALQTARANLSRYGLSNRIDLVQCDLLAPLGTGFDLVCANLPYIPTRELETLAVSRWEPHSALDGGTDGLTFIRRLLKHAGKVMAPESMLLLEIDPCQSAPALDFARQIFPHAGAKTLLDLSARERVLEVRIS